MEFTCCLTNFFKLGMRVTTSDLDMSGSLDMSHTEVTRLGRTAVIFSFSVLSVPAATQDLLNGSTKFLKKWTQHLTLVNPPKMKFYEHVVHFQLHVFWYFFMHLAVCGGNRFLDRLVQPWQQPSTSTAAPTNPAAAPSNLAAITIEFYKDFQAHDHKALQS